MDEYDELFEIQDDFEDQYADELEVLAQMEGEGKLANMYMTFNVIYIPKIPGVSQPTVLLISITLPLSVVL